MTAPNGTALKAPVEVPLGELRQHPGNPRRISDVRLEHLQRTLTAERGMLGARPLIALPDGTVIAGNQRLAAAVALGWESIPVVYADLDEEQAARWMLLDNRGFGEDDPELLAGMLRDLDARGVDLVEAGYLSADVDAILRAAQPVSSRDPDEAPAVPAVPKSARGVVYELGPHRVMCGDATSADDLDQLLGGVPARLLFTDPPYGVNYEGGAANEEKREQLIGDDGDCYTDALPIITQALDPRAAAYVFFAGSRMDIVGKAMRDSGWEIRALLIWLKLKAHYGAPSAQYLQRHEPFVYAIRRGKPPTWNGLSTETTIWEVDQPARNQWHPTQKPVILAERAIANSTDRGETVLDAFAGSGSTLIAAEQTGRQARLMEIDPAYVDVIRQRYADYTDQPQYAP